MRFSMRAALEQFDLAFPPSNMLSIPSSSPTKQTTSAPATKPPEDHRSKITTSTASISDFAEIADLRLSVFTPYANSPMKAGMRKRAHEKMVERLVRGAVCIIAREEVEVDPASTPESMSCLLSSQPHIVGSLECSTHEFDLCDLRQNEDQGMYITEVAVCPSKRRRGIGSSLLRKAEELAADREKTALYLHVDVANVGAMCLYERLGYERLEETAETFNFAAALGLHSGNLVNTKHVLMKKEIQ